MAEPGFDIRTQARIFNLVYFAVNIGGQPKTKEKPAMKTDEELTTEGKDPKSRYYNAGGIEVLDFIKAKLTPEQYEGALLFMLMKYPGRANFKGSFDRDIEKTEHYARALRLHREEMAKNTPPVAVNPYAEEVFYLKALLKEALEVIQLNECAEQLQDRICEALAHIGPVKEGAE